ncbi:MAG: hypothetical protein CL760_01415 [Chloroflexi bacterium]|nr:hypothetical protein [Chloroflexota bacterium]|tara:strand:- start:1184 stop:1789 length:606 start_codon:yes stop_codon:yes gene_type:complete
MIEKYLEIKQKKESVVARIEFNEFLKKKPMRIYFILLSITTLTFHSIFIYNSFIDSFIVNYLISNIASTLVGLIAISSLNIGGVKKENKKIQIVTTLISFTLLNYLSIIFSITTLVLIYMFREDFFNNKKTNINLKKKSEILKKEKENLWYKISKDRSLLKHIESDERLKKEIKLEYLKLKKDKTEDLLKHHFEIEEIKSS